MGNVSIVFMLFFLIFAILGVQVGACKLAGAAAAWVTDMVDFSIVAMLVFQIFAILGVQVGRLMLACLLGRLLLLLGLLPWADFSIVAMLVLQDQQC
jgi:hypothetical protein